VLNHDFTLSSAKSDLLQARRSEPRNWVNVVDVELIAKVDKRKEER